MTDTPTVSGRPPRYAKRMVTIQIDGLKEAQVAAIEDMLATWIQLGGLGASRWTAFYADGDGDFHPKITVNGQPPRFTPYLTREQRWGRCKLTETIYTVDYDAIAWALRARDEGKPVPSVDPAAGNPT